MFSPRASIVDRRRMDAKEEVEVVVRAGSKIGASVAARIEAAALIPIRDQRVVTIKNEDNERFTNVWEVVVRDREMVNSRWS